MMAVSAASAVVASDPLLEHASSKKEDASATTTFDSGQRHRQNEKHVCSNFYNNRLLSFSHVLSAGRRLEAEAPTAPWWVWICDLR